MDSRVVALSRLEIDYRDGVIDDQGLDDAVQDLKMSPAGIFGDTDFHLYKRLNGAAKSIDKQARALAIKLGPKDRRIHDRRFIPDLRKYFVDEANQLLEAGGHLKRLSAKSFADDDVDQVATTRIPRAAYALEREGKATVAGQRLAEEHAQKRLDAIAKARGHKLKEARAVVDRLELWNVPRSIPAATVIRELAAEYLSDVKWLADFEEQQRLSNLNHQTLDRIRQRRIKIKQQLAKPTTRQQTREKLQTEKAALDQSYLKKELDIIRAQIPLDRLTRHAPAIWERSTRVRQHLERMPALGALFTNEETIPAAMAAFQSTIDEMAEATRSDHSDDGWDRYQATGRMIFRIETPYEVLEPAPPPKLHVVSPEEAHQQMLRMAQREEREARERAAAKAAQTPAAPPAKPDAPLPTQPRTPTPVASTTPPRPTTPAIPPDRNLAQTNDRPPTQPPRTPTANPPTPRPDQPPHHSYRRHLAL